MPTATIAGNIVNLTVNARHGTLNLTVSLQRHHYRYCANGAALVMNSLLYASVTDQAVLTDANEVGRQMERLLENNHRPQVMFGVQFRCPSGRVYLVDNSALNPNGFPNHFFPTSGTSLWAQMSQAEYAAASAIRRVEEAINARPVNARPDFLNWQTLNAIRNQAGIANPVVAAYTAARTALNLVPNADANLGSLSGRSDIVAIARTF